jgi:protein-S-isoprenylcysteine O-methyltransferase Ste14
MESMGCLMITIMPGCASLQSSVICPSSQEQLSANFLLAIQFEERNMLREHSDTYEYRRPEPMLIPFVGKR